MSEKDWQVISIAWLIAWLTDQPTPREFEWTQKTKADGRVVRRKLRLL